MTDSEARRCARLQELLDGALQRSDDERAQFIGAACGDDAELRQELESLVDAAQKEGPLDGFGAVVVRPLLGPVRDLAASAGTRVGPYRLSARVHKYGIVFGCRGTPLVNSTPKDRHPPLGV